MKLKFKKKDTIGVINTYYSEVYGVEGNTNITTSKELVGYGPAESYSCVVNITFSGKINLGSSEVEFVREVNDEELNLAFRHYLDKSNIEVKSISLDSGLRTSDSGYMYETFSNIPYFNGVDVEVKDFVKERRGK